MNRKVRYLKYLGYVTMVAGVFVLTSYGVSATLSDVHTGTTPSFTEFITNAKTRLPTKLYPKSKTVKRTAPKQVNPKNPQKPSSEDKDRMQTVASYINQNKRNGLKYARYNAKSNTIQLVFNHKKNKKPTNTQKRYGRYLLRSMNAD